MNYTKAHPALSRAIAASIAKGAPVYINRNSFQQWAITQLAEHGIAAREKGNWIECETNRGQETIFTYAEVSAIIEDLTQ